MQRLGRPRCKAGRHTEANVGFPPIADIGSRCFCAGMTKIKTQELRTLFDWIVSQAEARWGDEVPLDQNFYRAPSLGSVFRGEAQSQPVGYGSIIDEADFHRASVLAGDDDLLDLVAERVGYVLLAIADTVEREQE